MDPLEQMQQLLQAQQRFWQAFQEQQKDNPNADFFNSANATESTAEQLSQQAKAYSSFAQSFVEQLQKQGNDSDVVSLFLESFKAYRESTLFNQLDLPPGLDAFFDTFVKQNAGFMELTAFQSHWNRQFDRIKARFKTTKESYTQFQQALSTFQALEQKLNQAIYESAQTSFTDSHFSESQSAESEAKLRELINLWVEIYEQHYLAMVQTEEYQQAYKELIRTSGQLQKDAQQTWDEEYRLLGLVPIQDYDELLEKHHKLEKQYRQQQKQLEALAEKVDQLSAPKQVKKAPTNRIRKAKAASSKETAQKS